LRRCAWAGFSPQQQQSASNSSIGARKLFSERSKEQEKAVARTKTPTLVVVFYKA
jgi:hypothetical protein